MDWTYARLLSLVKYLTDLTFNLAILMGMGLIIYFGLRMATSRDNATEFAKAKNSLIKVGIGLLIVFGAYTIVATIAGAVNSI